MKKQLRQYLDTFIHAKHKNKRLYWLSFVLSLLFANVLLSFISKISGYDSIWFSVLFGTAFIIVLHFKFCKAILEKK